MKMTSFVPATDYPGEKAGLHLVDRKRAQQQSVAADTAVSEVAASDAKPTNIPLDRISVSSTQSTESHQNKLLRIQQAIEDGT